MRITQKQISEITGMKQPNVSRAMKKINTLSFVPNEVKKVLKAQCWTIEINRGEK